MPVLSTIKKVAIEAKPLDIRMEEAIKYFNGLKNIKDAHRYTKSKICILIDHIVISEKDVYYYKYSGFDIKVPLTEPYNFEFVRAPGLLGSGWYKTEYGELHTITEDDLKHRTYPHPHFFTDSGMCIGSGWLDEFRKMLKSDNWAGLYNMLMAALQTYTAHDVVQGHNLMHVEDEMTFCSRCDCDYHPDDLSNCCECRELFCGECSYGCYECGEPVCEGCVLISEYEAYCPYCFNDLFRYCYYCSETVRYEDVSECHNCGAYVCENHRYYLINGTVNNHIFCEHCYEDLDECAECEEKFVDGDLNSSGLCTDCQRIKDEEFMETIIDHLYKGLGD